MQRCTEIIVQQCALQLTAQGFASGQRQRQLGKRKPHRALPCRVAIAQIAARHIQLHIQRLHQRRAAISPCRNAQIKARKAAFNVPHAEQQTGQITQFRIMRPQRKLESGGRPPCIGTRAAGHPHTRHAGLQRHAEPPLLELHLQHRVMHCTGQI